MKLLKIKAPKPAKKHKNTPVVVIKKARKKYHKLFFVLGATIGGAVGFKLRDIVDMLAEKLKK